MKLWLIPALCVIALTASISPAPAFEPAPNDQFPDTTLSTKLADPDDIIQDMSQRYSSNSATIARFGNTSIGIVGPSGGYNGSDGPFLPDPAAGMVPSKRQW
jgi:hypothetical protein